MEFVNILADDRLVSPSSVRAFRGWEYLLDTCLTC